MDGKCSNPNLNNPEKHIEDTKKICEYKGRPVNSVFNSEIFCFYIFSDFLIQMAFFITFLFYSLLSIVFSHSLFHVFEIQRKQLTKH